MNGEQPATPLRHTNYRIRITEYGLRITNYGIRITANRLPFTLLILWAALLTFGVYGRTLTFPFFSDDFFQLPFLDAHSLGALWRTAEGLFFFRPLAFTLWKLLYFVVGYDTAVFHLVNLLLHWFNGVLVAWLAARLWATGPAYQWPRGFVAGTLFLLFPFSYEGVAWVAAVMHPQFLALILLAIVGYWQAFYPVTPTGPRQAWLWGGASLLGVLLAPFAHENGVLVAPLLVLVEWTQGDGARMSWRRLARAGLWGMPLVFWLLFWRQVPAADGAGSLALNAWPTMGRNALYFVQGGAYPFTWAGGWLRDRFALDGFWVTALLALPALALLVWGQRRAGWSRRSWLPWLWTAVSVSLAILFLPWLHVSAAPRMLMLASVGLAWLWSDALWALAAGKRWRRALAGLLLAALLLQNGLFVRAQLDLYAIGGSAIRSGVAAAVAAHERGETAVFINFPAWIAPQRATYALGQEGDILVLGPELLPAMVWAHSGQWVDVRAARVDAIRQQPPYYTGPLGDGAAWDVEQPTAVFHTVYFTDTIQVQPAGRLGVAAAAPGVLATFAEGLRLLAGTAVFTAQGLQVDLTWQLAGPPPPDITVFVHVLDVDGQMLAQADGDPLAGTYPFSAWPAGTMLQDQRMVIAVEGAVAVQVGLYNRVTGERVTAAAADGAAWADAAVAVPVIGHP